MTIFEARSDHDNRTLIYNTKTQEVLVEGVPVRLSDLPRRLLSLFLENPNSVFSVDDLHEAIWVPAGKSVSENAVRRTVGTLRSAIELSGSQKEETAYIETVRGAGFKFTASVSVHDERSSANVESDVHNVGQAHALNAISAVSVFVTLRSVIEPSVKQVLFDAVRSFREHKEASDDEHLGGIPVGDRYVLAPFSLPPPPSMMRDASAEHEPEIPKGARVFAPNRYVDYDENDEIVGAGVFRMEIPRYNTNTGSIDNLFVMLKETNASTNEEALIRSPGRIKIEFFLSGRPESEGPSLVLDSIREPGRSQSSQLIEAVLLDDLVYSDQAYQGFSAKPAHTRIHIGDLKYARIRTTFSFDSLLLPGREALEEEYWPRLHNFQLIFHVTDEQLISLTFGPEHLESQIVTEPEDPLMVGAYQEIRIVLERSVTASCFENDVVTFRPASD